MDVFYFACNRKLHTQLTHGAVPIYESGKKEVKGEKPDYESYGGLVGDGLRALRSICTLRIELHNGLGVSNDEALNLLCAIDVRTVVRLLTQDSVNE